MKQRTEVLLLVLLVSVLAVIPVGAQAHTEAEFCAELAEANSQDYLPYREAWALAGYYVDLDVVDFNVALGLARDVTPEGEIGSGAVELAEDFARFSYRSRWAKDGEDVIAALELTSSQNPVISDYRNSGDQAIAYFFRIEAAIARADADRLDEWLSALRQDTEIWNHFNFYKAEAYALGPEATNQEYIDLYFAARERGAYVPPQEVTWWADVCIDG